MESTRGRGVDDRLRAGEPLSCPAMNRLLAAVFVSVALPCFASPAFATYLPQERIPTDSPVYRDLERLATSWGVQPKFLSSRPLRRAEALEFLRGLAEAHGGAEEDPAFQRALRFLDPATHGATKSLISIAGEDDERLEASPYASLLYEDDPRNSPDVNRDYRVGVAVAGALDTSSVFVANFYEGTASQGGRGTPDFGDFNSLIEGVNFNSYVNEAYVEFPISRLRFLFGHTWLRWGPGESGTLALSDAAPALDMLRVEAGMFRKLRYTQFVSLLDPGPETYLAGHRLEWTASGRITAGFTELARFDGTSQTPLYFIPFVPYSYWEKRPKSGGVSPADSTGDLLRKNNVLWAADVAWSFRPGWRVYLRLTAAGLGTNLLALGARLAFDITGLRPLGNAGTGVGMGHGTGGGHGSGMGLGTGGADWRRTLKGRGAIGAAVEYSRVNNFTYSVWHRHDFSYNGFPTGYVLGPDVQALSGEATLEWGPNLEFRLRGEWRRKGEGRVGDAWLKTDGKVDASAFQGVVERETRIGGSVIYSAARWLRVAATVGTSDLKNRDHVAGLAGSETPFNVSAQLAW